AEDPMPKTHTLARLGLIERQLRGQSAVVDARVEPVDGSVTRRLTTTAATASSTRSPTPTARDVDRDTVLVPSLLLGVSLSWAAGSLLGGQVHVPWTALAFGLAVLATAGLVAFTGILALVRAMPKAAVLRADE
ncbi:MAG: hypothetical protein M3O86_05235, partial [Actinomycetota bacterium]|nr:hypothetical protein [Actinomycetota bacterium]